MVKMEGVEPSAFPPQTERSTKLSYTLMLSDIMCLLSDSVQFISFWSSRKQVRVLGRLGEFGYRVTADLSQKVSNALSAKHLPDSPGLAAALE